MRPRSERRRRPPPSPAPTVIALVVTVSSSSVAIAVAITVALPPRGLPATVRPAHRTGRTRTRATTTIVHGLLADARMVVLGAVRAIASSSSSPAAPRLLLL